MKACFEILYPIAANRPSQSYIVHLEFDYIVIHILFVPLHADTIT